MQSLVKELLSGRAEQRALAIVVGLALLYWVFTHGTALSFQVLHVGSVGYRAGSDAEVRNAAVAVFATQEELATFSRQFVPMPTTTQPDRIDAATAYGVVVWRGMRPSNASDIAITNITRLGNHVLLHTHVRERGMGEGASPAMTDTAVVLLLDRADVRGQTLTFHVWKDWHSVASVTHLIP